MPSAPRILYITPANPFSAASGAEQRSAILLMALQAVGTVDVLVLAPGPGTRIWREPDDGDGVWRGEVRDGGGLLRYRPKPPLTHELESALGRTIDSYALVVGRYLWSLCQLVLPASVRTLVDLDDFRYRYGAQAGWSPSLVKERLVKAVNFQLARRQLHRFDAAFVVSERDKALLGGMPCLLLTNVPWKMPSHVAPLPTDKRVLFVGSLWYRPNADGIDWFLARVWPIVRAGEPTATLRLIGPAPPVRRAAWERHPGVSAPGYVDDLDAAYAASSLVVVPIHSGGGSNIKVLEAMAHGRPCVVTDLVQQAFAKFLFPGVHLATASDHEAFAGLTLSTLRDLARASEMADAGRQAVMERFHRAAMQAAAQSFAREVLLGSAASADALLASD